MGILYTTAPAYAPAVKRTREGQGREAFLHALCNAIKSDCKELVHVFIITMQQGWRVFASQSNTCRKYFLADRLQLLGHFNYCLLRAA